MITLGAVALLATAAAVGALLMYCYCQSKITKYQEDASKWYSECNKDYMKHDEKVRYMTNDLVRVTTERDIWKEQCEGYMSDINIFRAELGLPAKKVEQKYKVTF